MTRQSVSALENARTALRAALLAAALFAPLVAMQTVQAGSGSIIEDSRALSSGAGLVILVSLQRA